MRTRTITPEDLTDPLFETRYDGGEIERLQDDRDAIRALLAALIKTLTPAQMLAVYERMHEGREKYERADDGSWGVELIAEEKR